MWPYPRIGEARQTISGCWEAKARLGLLQQIDVIFVARRSATAVQANAAIREVVERVARKERKYRLQAARAWQDEFRAEFPGTRLWPHWLLAGHFVLRDIILGNDGDDQTIILCHSIFGFDLEKNLKTWFRPDGTLDHISGHL